MARQPLMSHSDQGCQLGWVGGCCIPRPARFQNAQTLCTILLLVHAPTLEGSNKLSFMAEPEELQSDWCRTC